MIERWVRFWDARERPESLALVRILVALVILWDLGTALSSGLLPDLWAPPPYGLGFTALGANPPRLVAWFGASTGTAWLAVSIVAMAALFVLVGVSHRPAALVLAWASAELARLSPDGDRAIDTLLRLAVLVLAFSRADACWSLRAWLSRRSGGDVPAAIPAWPRRLLFAQVVWMYSSAAHNRGGMAWWPWGGCSAIARILSDPHYARFPPGWTDAIYPLTQAMTMLTMAFELGSPLLLLMSWFDAHPERGGKIGTFVRRYRVRFLYLGLGALLHLGIALTLRLGIFSFGVLALYPVFLRPEEISHAVRRLRCALETR